MSFKKVAYWSALAGSLVGLVLLETNYGVLSTVTNLNNMGFMSAVYLFEPALQTINMVLAPYPKATPLEMQSPATQMFFVKKMKAMVAEIRDLVNDKQASPVDDVEETQYAVAGHIIDIPVAEEKIPDHAAPVSANLSLSLALPVLTPASENDDVAIIIPCHDSADKITATLLSCLLHVKPKQIFVIDNSNALQPTDNTREIVRGIHAEINYVWSHYGNKTIAQYVGVLISPYRYVLAIDDDVHLPIRLQLPKDHINDIVKAVCFPIRAIHPRKEGSLLIELQDLEYQFSDLAKLVQAAYAGGVLYPHGAVSFWEKETLRLALLQHDTVFYAEDLKLGLILQQMGKKMIMSAGSWFDTEAPASFFGEKPNLFEQRVRSWEMGRQVYFGKILWNFLSTWRPTFSENCFLKLSQFYDVYTNLSDWWRLPLLVFMGSDPQFWGRVAEFYAYNMVPALAWNYLKLPLSERKELQVPLRACLALPLYKAVSSALALGGALRAVTIYLPNFTAKPTIAEIEALETKDKAQLESELAGEPANGPRTFKRILHRNCFFQPAPTAQVNAQSAATAGSPRAQIRRT